MTAATSVLASHKRLAGFARDQLGEIGLVLAHDVGEAAHRLDPIGVRMRRPFRPGGARGGDFGRGIADLARPDLLAGRRIGRDELSLAASARRGSGVQPVVIKLTGASCSIARPPFAGLP